MSKQIDKAITRALLREDASATLSEKDRFNAVAPIAIYFGTDVMFKKQAQKGFTILKKAGDPLVASAETLDDVSDYQDAYNELVISIAEEHLPSFQPTYDHWGARCFVKEVHAHAPKDGVLAGDSSGWFAFYEGYDELVKAMQEAEGAAPESATYSESNTRKGNNVNKQIDKAIRSLTEMRGEPDETEEQPVTAWVIQDWTGQKKFPVAGTDSGVREFPSFEAAEEFLAGELGDEYEEARQEYYIEPATPISHTDKGFPSYGELPPPESRGPSSDEFESKTAKAISLLLDEEAEEPAPAPASTDSPLRDAHRYLVHLRRAFVGTEVEDTLDEIGKALHTVGAYLRGKAVPSMESKKFVRPKKLCESYAEVVKDTRIPAYTKKYAKALLDIINKLSEELMGVGGEKGEAQAALDFMSDELAALNAALGTAQA